MGSLDANGIWQYDGTDQMVPHHTYMNLLSGSVSNAVVDLIADLTVPSEAWTTITRANTASATGTFEYARFGSLVSIRASLTLTATGAGSTTGTGIGASAGFTIGTIPTGRRTSNTDHRVPQTGAGGNTFNMFLSTTGTVNVYGYGPGAAGTGNVLRIAHTYQI